MYPSSLPNIDLQVLPAFPANVVATGAVDISKSGLTYTFGLNFQNVIEETNVSDMSKREVLVQDTDTGAFWRVKLTNLPTGQTDWDNIQNKPATFPPSPHTHPVAEISDATPLGRALVTVADDAAARGLLGGTIIGSAVFTAPDEATAQAALDVPPNTRTISAGTGLTGGGDLSANRTLSLADMPQATVKGRAPGAGTGAPQDLTITQVLDALGTAQGSVIYRGASGWAALGAGTAGQVLTSGGAGADPSWQNAAAVAVDPLIPPEFVAGLTLSNNASDPNHKIDIAPGRARGSGVTVEISSTITKRLDANWTEGNGGGGLDTGSKAANATYHVFVIRKDDDGTGDVLLSTSATSPTVPSGWTRVQRLGAILTDGSGNIRPFVQDGNKFMHNVIDAVLDYSSTSVRALSPLTVTVPNGVRVEGIFECNITADNGDAGVSIEVHDGSNQNVRKRLTNYVNTGVNQLVTTIEQFTNTTRQVWLAVNGGPHPSYACGMRTLGWVDYQIPRIG